MVMLETWTELTLLVRDITAPLDGAGAEIVIVADAFAPPVIVAGLAEIPVKDAG